MGWQNDLSERELEILHLAAAGDSNKDIAQKLGISPNTVKVHLKNIFEKIGAATRTEAAFLYLKHQQEQDAARVSSLPEPAVPRYGFSAWLKINWKKVLLFFFLLGLLLAAYFLLWVPRQKTPISSPAVAQTGSRWQVRAPLPAARAAMAAAAYENTFYIFSGEGSSGLTGSVLRYDTRQDRWEERAAKPQPVSEAGAAVLGEKIYVPGGKQADGTPSRSLEVYDPRLDRWEERARLPLPISGYALAALEGRLYLFGGWNGQQFLSSVYEYDPMADRWAKIADMPQPCAYAGAVVVQNKILLFGGYDGKKALSASLAFYPGRAHEGAQPWQNLAPLPAGRYGMGAAGLVNQAYLLGGESDGSPASPAALQYSLATDRWLPLEAPLQADASFLALLPLETRLYGIGGRQGHTLLTRHQAYQAIYTILIPMIESQ